MKQAAIAAIEYHLPAETVSSERLAAEFPEWSVAKIDEKTGISERHIAAQDECASDLAVEAASKLFAAGACQPAEIDYILFCTQSPDYILPTTACAIQGTPGGTEVGRRHRLQSGLLRFCCWPGTRQRTHRDRTGL